VEAPVVEYVKSILKHGVTHHLIVVHGQIAGQLEKAAELMRIEHLIVR
jgi:creatinine amidohydrolase/Fe(II)-dependent formamide hydrolase-like protein